MLKAAEEIETTLLVDFEGGSFSKHVYRVHNDGADLFTLSSNSTIIKLRPQQSIDILVQGKLELTATIHTVAQGWYERVCGVTE